MSQAQEVRRYRASAALEAADVGWVARPRTGGGVIHELLGSPFEVWFVDWGERATMYVKRSPAGPPVPGELRLLTDGVDTADAAMAVRVLEHRVAPYVPGSFERAFAALEGLPR